MTVLTAYPQLEPPVNSPAPILRLAVSHYYSIDNVLPHTYTPACPRGDLCNMISNFHFHVMNLSFLITDENLMHLQPSRAVSSLRSFHTRGPLSSSDSQELCAGSEFYILMTRQMYEAVLTGCSHLGLFTAA